VSLLITGGRIIDPANQVDTFADIYLSGGKVAAIGDQASAFQARQTIDATGLVICPGFVDLYFYIPEPGYEQKGTVESETKAAAAGGVTSLCCPPATSPIIDSPSIATSIQKLASQSGYGRIWPIGAMTMGLKGAQLSEMATLKKAGCIGVTNMRYPFDNTRVLLRCLEYAASQDMTAFLQSIDLFLEQDGCVHNGPFSTRLGLPGIPETAETVALARDLLLVEQTGVRAHFSQLSTAKSVDMIADAQAKGLNITADVCIHHLLSTDECIEDFNCLYHIQPPLRDKADRQRLREGVSDGVLIAISSQHQPHETAAKMAPFAETAPGISGVETLLPLALELVDNGMFDLSTMIARLTCGPAGAANINAGNIGVGQRADICIFDPKERWLLSGETLHSKGKNTPHLNTMLKGRVRYTLVKGRRVFQS